jgi:hypothetical protein
MRKLTLDIDELEIESFEAAPQWQTVGTVRAQEEAANDVTRIVSEPCYCPMTPDFGC